MTPSLWDPNPAGGYHPLGPKSQNVCPAASLKKPTLIYELILQLNPLTHQKHGDKMLADGLCLLFWSLLIPASITVTE